MLTIMTAPPRHPTFVLRQAYLAMRKAMDESLQAFDLTAAHFEVLQMLIVEDCQEHRVLQERLGISSPTLSNILDSMAQRGMIVRTSNASDARVKNICMGDAAAALHDSAAFRMEGERFTEHMLAGFSPREREQFLRALERVADNLNAPPAQAKR
jgi:DNA-binding MarR family transcriptional regulator